MVIAAATSSSSFLSPASDENPASYLMTPGKLMRPPSSFFLKEGGDSNYNDGSLKEEGFGLDSSLHNDGNDPRSNRGASSPTPRTPIRRINSQENQKDEIAYCTSLACMLSKKTDLPMLCQNYHSVVRTVTKNGGGAAGGGGVNDHSIGGGTTSDYGLAPPQSDR